MDARDPRRRNDRVDGLSAFVRIYGRSTFLYNRHTSAQLYTCPPRNLTKQIPSDCHSGSPFVAHSHTGVPSRAKKIAYARFRGLPSGLLSPGDGSAFGIPLA